MFISFSSIYNFWKSRWAWLHPCVSALLWSVWTYQQRPALSSLCVHTVSVCVSKCVCLLQLIPPTVCLCAYMYFYRTPFYMLLYLKHTEKNTHTHMASLSLLHPAVLQKHVIYDEWLWQICIYKWVNQQYLTSGDTQEPGSPKVLRFSVKLKKRRRKI